MLLIWLVDAADRDRIDESVTTLRETLNNMNEPEAGLLIVLNKADLDQAITEDEFSNHFNSEMIGERQYSITRCSAFNGLAEDAERFIA